MQITQPVICAQEAFLLPEAATGAPGQHDQQVFFWWLSSLGPEWVPSLSHGSTVCVRQGHVAALGPPALLSTPPVESIPRLFPADSPTRQFEFHFGSSGGEKKRFLPPTETISFSSSTSISTASGLHLSQRGGSQPTLTPACSRPRAERWPEAAPKLAAAWGHQLCSHLLWDTLSAAESLAQKLLLAKWLQPGILAYL